MKMEPLEVHRLDNNSSKLPTYRLADLRPGSSPAFLGQSATDIVGQREDTSNKSNNNEPITSPRAAAAAAAKSKLMVRHRDHARTHSETSCSLAVAPSSVKRQPLPLPRPQTFTCTSTSFPSTDFTTNTFDKAHALATKPPKARIPASHSSNGIVQDGRPPLAMLTQRSFKLDTSFKLDNPITKDWVAAQSINIPPTTTIDHEPTPPSPALPKSTRSSTERSRPQSLLIKPIRGFKPSTRKSVDMPSSRMPSDPDITLRVLEGTDSRPSSRQPEHEETNSDESDLFLRAAREEEMSQQASNPNVGGPSRTGKRMSRIAQRASLPPPAPTTQTSISRRRGSDLEGLTGLRPMDEQEAVGQALTYRPSSQDRATTLEDINRSRYAVNSRSNPTTPRIRSSREISPESQVSYSGRRPSVPDYSQPARSPAYRQSNLSYSTPRNYNSSPLVSRPTDVRAHETPDTQRIAEGTESTVSTTAPSTVWDELDDLKSRIHRLELTGKLPATSGAAVSRASNDRPATATTTVTTMSASPKRGRNNSISPIDVVPVEPPAEFHPLLHSALAKSKPLLDPETYKTLEATATDALSIAAMMGSSGQPGPISSSQSTIGGSAAVSDRQVRRKADSLCRSLTELCLALSEGKIVHTPQPAAQISALPSSRGTEVGQSIESGVNPRQPMQSMNTDLVRTKSSPRALNRFEARRSSLLAGSSLPSTRYTPSEGQVSTQSSMAGRRTSLLLRSRRGGTEDAEEYDEARFRAPSRATTEMGRLRNSPREYVSQEPLPERPQAVHSSLPVRSHYTTIGSGNTAPSVPPVSSLGGRRYLDRSTLERDTTSVVGRLAEDRSQKRLSLGFAPIGRTGSLTRKARQPNSTDLSSAAQNGSY